MSSPCVDPCVVVDADGMESSKQTLKKISFPALDDDAVPSAIAVKVLGCVGKWELKLEGLVQLVEEEEQGDSCDPVGEEGKQPTSSLKTLLKLLLRRLFSERAKF